MGYVGAQPTLSTLISKSQTARSADSRATAMTAKSCSPRVPPQLASFFILPPQQSGRLWTRARSWRW